MAMPAIRTRYALTALVIIEFLVTLPYLLGGPVFFREDWEFIRNYRANAEHVTDPTTTAARPLVAAVDDVLYPIAVHQPTLIHALQVGLVAGAGCLLFLLLARRVDRLWAFAVAALWLVLPMHLSLDHWIASFNIALALAFLLLGLLVLDTRPDVRGMIGFAVAISIGTLCYEAVFPMAIILGVFLLYRRVRIQKMALFIAFLVPVAVFVALQAPGKRELTRASITKAVYENFGLSHQHQTFALIMLAAMTVIFLIATYRLVQRKESVADRMVVFGVVLAMIGIVPFLTSGYDVAFVGLGDRFNCISSLGVAIGIAGAIRLVVPNLRVASGIFVAFAIGVGCLHVETSLQWLHASRSVVAAGDKLLDAGIAGRPRIVDDTEAVPGAALGLNAATELSAYMESGWRHPSAKVDIVRSESKAEVSAADLIEAAR